jgi:hypothetical protein
MKKGGQGKGIDEMMNWIGFETIEYLTMLQPDDHVSIFYIGKVVTRRRLSFMCFVV